MRDAPHVEHLLPTGTHSPRMSLEDAENHHSDNPVSPSQDRFGDHHHYYLPQEMGREDQPALEGGSQDSPEWMDHDDLGKNCGKSSS